METDDTKPPPRYSEATLLSAMEGAGKLVDDEELAEALKEKGLGTPATRAATIEHLIKEKIRQKRRNATASDHQGGGFVRFPSRHGSRSSY